MYKLSTGDNKNDQVVFVVIGASGDLSKKKIYPTLWSLYKQKLIGENTQFVGYARSKLTHNQLIESFTSNVKISDSDRSLWIKFQENNHYLAGNYNKDENFVKLNDKIIDVSHQNNKSVVVNRIFYLAVPSSVFADVTKMIRTHCWTQNGNEVGDPWCRIILEKPFGYDLASSNALSHHISQVYKEQQVYRIDHYLGKEMVKNLLVLRFGNILFRSMWSRDFISSVQIVFKEPFGVEGRAGYFNDSGIIRDIIQNHLLQILSLIAMEKPLSISAENIRGEKLKALKAIPELTLNNLVIGQYVGNPSAEDPKARVSYQDLEGVPPGSITPTYACAVVYVNNERWEGVPFIMRCGKALNERKAEIRIQLKDVPGDIFARGQLKRNELVIRVQPREAVYIKVMNKKPGALGDQRRKDLTSDSTAQLLDVVETELELSYDERYANVQVPDAYDNLILDVFDGLQMDFVHTDELREAWRILDPVLSQLTRENVAPLAYIYGSRNGPEEADKLIESKGYKYTGTYVYHKPNIPKL